MAIALETRFPLFDEMLTKKGGARPPYKALSTWIEKVGIDFLRQRREEAETIFQRLGVTFSVYSDGGDPERLIPFDVIPRIYDAEEWRSYLLVSFNVRVPLMLFCSISIIVVKLFVRELFPWNWYTK